MKRFEIIEHTADIGIKIFGSDLKELFCNAAAGMFDIIADSKEVNRKKHINVEVKADNIEELLVNWLTELLFHFNANFIILKEFSITEISQNNIKAVVSGEKIDKNKHSINTEIKAVTYHELKVEKKDFGWNVQVIFDV